jgi:NAD(P)-dependent dehydrogenase (short-subunit alcohol dehydrogenase family)
MTAFFESVRLDVKHSGVDVSIIQPGFIRTPLTSARAAKMPFLMELDDAIPLFIKAIEKKKKFAAFPWQLATIGPGREIYAGVAVRPHRRTRPLSRMICVLQHFRLSACINAVHFATYICINALPI